MVGLHSRLIRRSRGSVIVLVVAVLTLLAVIGTVYIVSARAERNSAQVSNVAVNLDNAVQAVDKLILQKIGESRLDAAGVVGSYNIAGSFGEQSARRWDIREVGTTNPKHRDQPWLVSELYRTGMYDNSAPDVSIFTPGLFNPVTSRYDLPYNNFAYMFNAVGDYYPAPGSPSPNQPLPFPNSADPNAPRADALINLLPFSEATGIRYRFGGRILDTSSMANLNVGIADSAANIGTYDTNVLSNSYFLYPNTTLPNPGIFDPSDNLINLNAAGGRFGSLTPPLPLPFYWARATFGFEQPNPIVPFNQTITPFDLSDELELRSYGMIGTLNTARPAQILPNTLGNVQPAGSVVGNFRRGSYTTYSYSRELRPYPDPILPKYAYTLTPTSRAALSLPAPVGFPANYVWPPFPAKVSAAPDVSLYIGYSADNVSDYLAMAATNIATAMELFTDPDQLKCYSHQDACAFAANYLTYRWNSWEQVPGVVDASGRPVYSLPNGPSFVDKVGLHVRGPAFSAGVYYAADYGSLSDLKAESDKVYLGYAAQPFINEIAIVMHASNDPTPVPSITDTAIELYNPYNVNLALNDYELRINGSDVDLGALATKYIPARGCFVITATTAPLATNRIDAAATKDMNPQVMLNIASTNVQLLRKYRANGGAQVLATIDQYNCTSLASSLAPATAGADEVRYIRRSNELLAPGAPSGPLFTFLTAVHSPITAERVHSDGEAAPEVWSLGAPNPLDAGSPAPLPLFDKTIGFTGPAGVLFTPPTLQGTPFYNISDFNRIMRRCNEVDATGNPVTGPFDRGVLTDQLHQIMEVAQDSQVVNSQCPVDACLHFDFRSPGWIYNVNTGYPLSGEPYDAYLSPATPPNGQKDGDPRAMKLLECLSFVDRVSDFSIDLGDNGINRGISKIRIPGKINVNTASADVLAAIPVLGNNPQYIGAILAYRWRTTSTDARIPLPYRSGTYTFTDTTTYPGYGIRSLGELNAALTSNLPFPPATLDDRDQQAWALIYNMCTVRSDTFVVYGYLEGVRQNPRYNNSPPFDNSTMWYSNVYGTNITDDPNDTNIATIPLLRVARRRWVAIVDGSGSNFNRTTVTGVPDQRFTLPKIVAYKDLPR